MSDVRIGTAGWAIPRTVADAFPKEGTGLQRYAAVFDAVEINSTFYRPHRTSTLERWAQTTPASFRFAVKIPKAITHDARLIDQAGPLAAFVETLAPLAAKLDALLVQLPPSLAFNAGVAERFFAAARAAWPELRIACEPRHASWFEAEADALMVRQHITRVAADPPRHPLAFQPGGYGGWSYWRLHGSPVMYRSVYGPETVGDLAARVQAPAWIIFDNTTLGGAAADALALKRLIA